MTYYLHETPGRLRVRTPLLKNSVAEAERVIRVLTTIRGVRRIATNTTTGSVTIRFCERTVCPSHVIHQLSKHGFIGSVIAFPRRKSVQPRTLSPTLANPLRIEQRRARGPLLDDSRRPEQAHKPRPTRTLSPQTRKMIAVAAKIVLPMLAERAFGKTGKEILSALL